MVALPVVLTVVLKFPVFEAATGGLAVNVSVVPPPTLGLLMAMDSLPLVSVDEKLPEKVPVLLAYVARPV